MDLSVKHLATSGCTWVTPGYLCSEIMPGYAQGSLYWIKLANYMQGKCLSDVLSLQSFQVTIFPTSSILCPQSFTSIFSLLLMAAVSIAFFSSSPTPSLLFLCEFAPSMLEQFHILSKCFLLCLFPMTIWLGFIQMIYSL